MFGMEGVAEEDWESRMNTTLDFISEDDDEITEMTESDGRITLTTVSTVSNADAEFYPEEIQDEIVPGTKSVCKLEVDAETYIIYSGKTYLQKPDGTELKVGEFMFSYDVTPYEPSEEMLQIINGTDKTVTLIADPGTEQEKTYVKSCGENGRLLVMLPDGYEKIYEDESCTQESEPSDENGERTLYTVKEH